MLDYQITAISKIREYAEKSKAERREFVEQICKPFNVDVNLLVNRVLSNPITLNFHPDRMSNNQMLIIDSLMQQGLYHGQFRTGTTNGGKSAYIGGDRFSWEQRLFFDAYPHDSLERPKYGALNLFRYSDGATARFGSCFLSLKSEVIKRCTFSYGDSSTNPTALCTSDTFVNILAGIFEDVQKNKKFLDMLITTEQETLAVLLNTGQNNWLGRNLDYCIEAHIHGDISLANDVECFYLDESYQGGVIAEKAELLCQKYGITLCWIPKRQLAIEDISEFFRGEKIPLLARKIDNTFGENKGVINASLIGIASYDSLSNPINWQDIGTESEIFQYFKQLWHTVAYFG